MTDSDSGGPIDPMDAFTRLSLIKFGDNGLDGVLRQIAELARRSIPGAVDVSVTLVRGSRPHSAAFTGELALALDESQYEHGHGPCLDAAASGEIFSLPDMSSETRWPDLAERALRSGCHSSLSIGLPLHDRAVGALNIYALKPHAFDDDAVGLAQTFAGYAGVALAHAYLYDSTATLAEHMRKAMQNRAVIEQAKGIIMGDRHCTADEAFQTLSKLSQDTDRKLRDVAATVVARTGGTPRP